MLWTTFRKRDLSCLGRDLLSYSGRGVIDEPIIHNVHSLAPPRVDRRVAREFMRTRTKILVQSDQLEEEQARVNSTRSRFVHKEATLGSRSDSRSLVHSQDILSRELDSLPRHSIFFDHQEGKTRRRREPPS